MYESFFGLRSRPFAAAPDARCYFPAQAAENARQTLGRVVERAEGAGLLVGPAGSGKTLLCRVIAAQFAGQFQVAMLDSGRICSRRALLQAILFELGLPYRNLEEGELRLALIDHLSPRGPLGLGLLLLIDEAHSLPLRLLEELRMITNLVRDGQPSVRLILAGGPALEERFASPKLESFNQRIAARCYLESFQQAETVQFIRSAVEAAGGKPDRILAQGTAEAVHRATDGVPRLVNQVCDHALILACAAGKLQIDAAGIEEAWADLQQLPTPWNMASRQPSRDLDSHQAGIIEFGALDEDASSDQPESVPFPTIGGEPLDQVERIQNHLATIDDDFEPAGNIRPAAGRISGAGMIFDPEVELEFPPGNNPFGDGFEDEEVVIDRYASLGVDPLDNRPLVASREGIELGKLLSCCECEESPPKLVIAEPSLDVPPREEQALDGRPRGEQLQFAENRETIDRNHSLPAIVMPTPSELHSWRAACVETVGAEQPVQVTLADEPDASPIVEVVALDDDLIVVEDDPHDPEVNAVREMRPVRRQEYRQLFAKLRRG